MTWNEIPAWRATRLSVVAHGRDNNFNLIRFCAALAVLMSHSFSLTGRHEPLSPTYGVTWGDLAVDAFFVTSGFLVTASLVARGSVVGFIWARVLRILPALWLMIILTVFGLGLALTASTHYLSDPQTWRYLLKNAILIRGTVDTLPGVFLDNPWPKTMNLPLWTLTPEIKMYALLLLVWVVTKFRRERMLFHVAVITVAAIAGVIYLAHGAFSDQNHQYPRLIFMFFTGSGLHVLKRHVWLSRPLFYALMLAVLLSAANRTAFFFAVSIATPYLLLFAAYGFGGVIRAFNRLGDYSYGIYIYAFPLQQTIVHFDRNISTGWLMVTASLATLLIAAVSWHVLEERALSLKAICAEKTTALFERKRTGEDRAPERREAA